MTLPRHGGVAHVFHVIGNGNGAPHEDLWPAARMSTAAQGRRARAAHVGDEELQRRAACCVPTTSRAADWRAASGSSPSGSVGRAAGMRGRRRRGRARSGAEPAHVLWADDGCSPWPQQNEARSKHVSRGRAKPGVAASGSCMSALSNVSGAQRARACAFFCCTVTNERGGGGSRISQHKQQADFATPPLSHGWHTQTPPAQMELPHGHTWRGA